jgi:hypothetical protein
MRAPQFRTFQDLNAPHLGHRALPMDRDMRDRTYEAMRREAFLR